MPTVTGSRSRLVKIKVCNLGCIGPDGVEIDLDEIVCLVGANNAGKSTVLRAYELAATSAEITSNEVFCKDVGKHPGFVLQCPTVELWVHIPSGAENIDEKWKEAKGDLLLVRSKWTWPVSGGKPDRKTWDPEKGVYAEDGKAGGLDTVFQSRLPRPFRIGSLDNPEAEHKKLLDLVLMPIREELASLMKDEKSQLREKAKDLLAEANTHVAMFNDDLETVQIRVDKSYRRVFNQSQVRLSVSLGELPFDPGAALLKSSRVSIVEDVGETHWSQQGTGSQRTLFWSMLEVRSELNRVSEEKRSSKKLIDKLEKDLGKKQADLLNKSQEKAIKKAQEDIEEIQNQINQLKNNTSNSEAPFLPGYMLLIDEPETALHPSAVRAAKNYLYALALESGWQVMLTTHHPAFVDPTQDHTTIVRLNRSGSHGVPNVYRSDSVEFNLDEMKKLKLLLAFDQSVSEMFFAEKVIVVEGDTEFAAFNLVMDQDPQKFPIESRPLILRARGKWTIPLLVRMLSHFRIPFAVVHDVDAPRIGNGTKKNSAYSANSEIADAVASARADGVHVIHRCSVPDFERHHGMSLPSKDKPFHAWRALTENEEVKSSVLKILDTLLLLPTVDDADHENDGKNFENLCKTWAGVHAGEDPTFTFETVA